MKVYEYCALGLKRSGAEALFGVVGHANLDFVDAYCGGGGGRYVKAKSEAAAVLMAIGYAQVTCAVGFATVTCGPGLTNAVTALVEATKSGTGIVLLAGDSATGDWEHTQFIDQRSVVLATGAAFEQLEKGDSAPRSLMRALRRAAVERRPVVLNMPVDVQETELGDAAAQASQMELGVRTIPAPSGGLDATVGIIATARWPVVLAGRGAIAARAPLSRLAERLGAPVATTLRGMGLFSGDPFDLGVCGTTSTQVATDTLMASDCILAVGASLNKFTTARGSLTKGKRVVQIDANASQIGRLHRVDAGVVGDAGASADLIVKLLDDADIPGADARTPRLRSAIAGMRDSREGASPTNANGSLNPFWALREINRAIDTGRTLVTGGGRFLDVAWREMSVAAPEHYVHTVSYTAIGLALSEAVGAAVGRRDAPTLVVTGDGGLMLGGLSEVVTAVNNTLNLVVVICNDGSYGAEHYSLTSRGRDAGPSILRWPDFEPIVRAMGADGITVSGPQEMSTALDLLRNRDTNVPFFVDLKLDATSMPVPTPI